MDMSLPEAASATWPPRRIRYCSAVVLMRASLVSCRPSAPDDPSVLREPLCEQHGDRRQQDQRKRDHVDDRELGTEPDVAEDQQRQRVLRPCCEVGDDDLVEREREGEQAAGDEGGGEDRPDDEAE